VSELVILCLVYFLFVIVWLSVPVQSIARRDSSPNWPVMCWVEC